MGSCKPTGGAAGVGQTTLVNTSEGGFKDSGSARVRNENEIGIGNSDVQNSSQDASTDIDISKMFRSARGYEELNIIGTGAYGTVYKARDLQNPGQIVALKRLKIMLTEDGLPLSSLREITLLKQLGEYKHPNIVRLLDICHANSTDRQVVLFLVFEHAEQDLASFLERVPRSGLPERQIREMSRQILLGIDFLHSHRIVHRDLKPQNLLVTAAGTIKLADFGLAKTYDMEMKLTSVVVTLWYRPPEVLLGLPYNTSVDIWSAACVIAEIIALKPVFPGVSEGDQLDKIFRFIGTPSAEDWPENSSVCLDNFPAYPRLSFSSLSCNISSTQKDLLKSMLTFDPRQRLTAEACLEHQFFSEEPL